MFPHHQHQHTLAVVLECSPPISLLDSHLHNKCTSELNLLRESCVLQDSNGPLKTGVAVRIRRPQKSIIDSSCWSILSLHRILPTSLMPHGFWDDRHRMILILAHRLSSSEKLPEYGSKQTGNKQMVQRTKELEDTWGLSVLSIFWRRVQNTARNLPLTNALIYYQVNSSLIALGIGYCHRGGVRLSNGALLASDSHFPL